MISALVPRCAAEGRVVVVAPMRRGRVGLGAGVAHRTRPRPRRLGAAPVAPVLGTGRDAASEITSWLRRTRQRRLRGERPRSAAEILSSPLWSLVLIQRSLLQRSDSAVKRGDRLGMRAPGIIVPVRHWAARLPFKCIGGILER